MSLVLVAMAIGMLTLCFDGRYRLMYIALGNAVAMRQRSWALGDDP